MTRKEKMDALIRRKNHLMERVSESDKDLTFDKRELAALIWAINELNKQK